MLTEARTNLKKKIKNTSLPGSLDEDTFTAEYVVNVSNCLKKCPFEAIKEENRIKVTDTIFFSLSLSKVTYCNHDLPAELKYLCLGKYKSIIKFCTLCLPLARVHFSYLPLRIVDIGMKYDGKDLLLITETRRNM